jgi:hypothetical protein
LESNIRNTFDLINKILSEQFQILKKIKENSNSYKMEISEFNRRMKVYQEIKGRYELSKNEYDSYMLRHAVRK